MASNRMKVGDVEIISVVDSVFPCPINVGFPSVSAERWQEAAPEIAATGVARLTITSFVVREAGRTILVDTGIGPAGGPGAGIEPGRLPEALRAEGMTFDDIDAVVITHLHGDHTGWNARQENGTWVPTFPRARYYIARGEYEHFTQPDQLRQSPFVEGQAMALVQQGRVELYDSETALGGAITLIPTPGHTPYHTTVAIASGDERAFILGDIAHHPAQVTYPDIRTGFDTDGDLAQRTREAMWERVGQLGARVAAGHFPPPSFGRVIVAEGRRLWQAL